MKRVRLAAVLVGGFVVTALLLGSDRPKDPRILAEAVRNKRETAIPKGSIRIPLPSIEQPNGYSCGAASLMAICSFYGVGAESIRDFQKQVHSDRVNGTYYKNMVSYAHELGLEAQAVPNMTLEQLRQHLTNGVPVICSIQAYGRPKEYDLDKSGHYVVAIGFDEENFYFMDPSIPAEHRRRGFLSKEELDRRWHDDEANEGNPPEPLRHLGIVVYPKDGHTAFVLKALHIP